MSAERRNQDLAADLARRALAAAERRRAEPEELRARLEDVAAGRISPDEAIEALTGEERRPINPFHDPDYLARQAARATRDRERLFGPEPEPTEPPTRPEGMADGGQGTAGTENHVYEDTPDHGRMRVFTDEELGLNRKEKR